VLHHGTSNLFRRGLAVIKALQLLQSRPNAIARLLHQTHGKGDATGVPPLCRSNLVLLSGSQRASCIRSGCPTGGGYSAALENTASQVAFISSGASPSRNLTNRLQRREAKAHRPTKSSISSVVRGAMLESRSQKL